jgi:hypothetical protein
MSILICQVFFGWISYLSKKPFLVSHFAICSVLIVFTHLAGETCSLNDYKKNDVLFVAGHRCCILAIILLKQEDHCYAYVSEIPSL